MRKLRKLCMIFLLMVAIFSLPMIADAASFSVSPSSGSFSVGSTFDVKVFLDTDGQAINAMQISLKFPPNLMQVVSPSSGQSIIGVWTSQPEFNNRTGEITLQGGIPRGINTSSGLIANITFRATRTGTAVLRFLDDSQILLHDGQGTDVLNSTSNGVYSITLPPPEGPTVVSDSHPEQSKWYSKSSAVFEWAGDDEVEGYSYALNQEPVFEPDNVSEGSQKYVFYEDLESGTHYFHIKALRDGVWGGVTHYGLNVDTEPPASFPINVIPGAKTSSNNPVVEFKTTDALSGLDHYEFKSISLNPEDDDMNSNQSFFIESQGRHVLSLEDGKYDVIARAYDKAGNVREVTERIQIMGPIALMMEKYAFVWALLTLIIIGGGFWGFRTHKWHSDLDERHKNSEMPDEVKRKLERLKEYERKYNNKARALLPLILAISIGVILGFSATPVHAQQTLPTPVINQVSENISNEDIFYVGGNVRNPESDVVIHIQNKSTGETASYTISPNADGEWLYRHPSFLSSGDYILWAQARLGGQESPPSPQIEMSVTKTAFSIGSSRISEKDLYLILFIIFSVISLLLFTFIAFHLYHGHHKKRELWKEVEEVEDAIRKGFVSIKKDIERELESIETREKEDYDLAKSRGERKEELLEDLREVKKHIGKELEDLEKLKGKI